MITAEIRKKLSANDVGETGTHQAGILVPKEESILSFFPTLDRNNKNPRITLTMREKIDRARWDFNFIYYNNRLFGGTRNEFRLTCMTRYLRQSGAKAGDDLVFSRDEDSSYTVDLIRETAAKNSASGEGILILSGGWKIINVR